MRKLTIALVLSCLSLPAFADELADAQKLWDNKQFSAAFAAFSQLAAAGNPTAQLQLGEMYGFGEGTAEDLAQARNWLDKAVKSGHPEAANSLALVNQRAARKSDISYYMGKFDGGAARYENFGCKRPALPEVSASRVAIKEVTDSIKDWRDCYDKFAAHLNQVAAPEKTISADVLNLMNNEEFKQASRHIGETYEKISSMAQQEGTDFYKDVDNWMARTTAHLEKVRNGQDPETRRLLAENQYFMRNYAETVQNRPAQPPSTRRK